VFLVFGEDDGDMEREQSEEQLLSTGQAATLLGVSRQHVVDLCTRGALPFVTTGTHRRIRRSDVEPLLAQHLTREAERSLWLHRAVAGRLVGDPEDVLRTAVQNLGRLQETHPSGMSAHWLSCWQEVLGNGVDTVLDTLVSRAPLAIELRQNSPFAGVLTNDERAAVHAAFREHWRRDHAA
jgi:excisionase family DNA binding protein